MKKILFMVVLSAALLAGCSSGKDGVGETVSNSSSSTPTVESTVQEDVKPADQFEGVAEVGEGAFNLAHTSGYTAEGDKIVVLYDPDTFPTAIGIHTEDIDGSLMSYLYVDGMLVNVTQLGTSQDSVEIQDTPNAITEGEHKLQLVQYDNDSEDGEIVTYKEQPFTIKVK